LIKTLIYIFIILLFNNILHANNIKDFYNITSHSVIYDLRIKKVLPSSKIHNAIGKMELEVSEVCDGWVINQNTTIDFTDKNGLQVRNEYRYSSWESFDYKLFRFISQVIIDEEESSYYEGEAFLNNSESKILLHKPNKKEIDIPHDTIFPMQHYIDTYRNKVNFKTYNVFTGEDDKALNYFSSFSTKVLIDDVLYKKVRSAIFKYTNITSEPIYEIELIINKQGIVKKVIFDYKNYSIVGIISSLEYKDIKSC